MIEDESRWSRYIIDSIIEISLSRDIMLMTRVHKPVLLRRLFEVGCHCSGEIISYQQILGQLQDTGNVTTLAQYLELLTAVGFVAGLQKFSLAPIRQKSSSPKLQALNTALMTAQSHFSFNEALQRPELWKNLERSSIGAHLLNSTYGTKIDVFYWKEGGREIDFILRLGEKIVTFEIDSEPLKHKLYAREDFARRFHPHRQLLIGSQGIPVEEFLLTPPEEWLI